MSFETLAGLEVAAESVERQSLTDKLLAPDPESGRWVEVRERKDTPPIPSKPKGGAPDVDGARLLDEVAVTFRRFVVFPTPACCVAATLWTAHAHALEAFESTPRLAYISPEKGSGKTRALEVHEGLVPAPMHAVNLTAAAIFRKIGGDSPPTLLMDEADTYLGLRVADRNEEIRGLVNAGHRRGAVAYRCVGEPAKMEVREFPAFAAVALAGIGDLPDTIIDRSIVIRMRRRAPSEPVESFRQRDAKPLLAALRASIAAWAAARTAELRAARPEMPDGIVDRPADVWEPLIAIADAAGGTWPERAREAAVELNAARRRSDPSLGVQLLADIRSIFEAQSLDRISSEELVKALCDLDEAPWGDLRGKPIDARGVARRLRKFDVSPHVVRIGDQTPRGYERTDLHDAWLRYLPALPSPDSATSATNETVQVEASSPVADTGPVADASATRNRSATDSGPLTRDVAPVAPVADSGPRPKAKGAGDSPGALDP